MVLPMPRVVCGIKPCTGFPQGTSAGRNTGWCMSPTPRHLQRRHSVFSSTQWTGCECPRLLPLDVNIHFYNELKVGQMLPSFFPGMKSEENAMMFMKWADLSGAFILPAVSEIVLAFPTSLERRLKFRKRERLACPASGGVERSPGTMPVHITWKDFVGWSYKPSGLKAEAASQGCSVGHHGLLKEGGPEWEHQDPGKVNCQDRCHRNCIS